MHIRSTFRACLLLLCCGFITGPQVTLQIGAWGWMLASYSQESSLEQAILETFGGDRPCEMCKIIEQSETSESEPFSTATSKEWKEIKLMLGLAQAISLPSNPQATRSNTTYLRQALEAHRTAIAPPPRNRVS